MPTIARLTALVVVLPALTFWTLPAAAAECASVTLPDSVKSGTADLPLNGLGLRTATFLKVKVYVAGLYLPQKSGDAAQILAADRPWRVDMRYVHDVGAKDIRGGFEEGLKAATGDKFESLRPRLAQLNGMMKDVASGQYLAFTNEPGKGLLVDVNGGGGGIIPGADFANALLANWIGPKTPNRDLRTGMLGGACG